MRIGVEINWGHKPGGSRTVTKNVLKKLSVIDRENTYIVFSNTFYPELKALNNIDQVVFSCPSPSLHHFWDQFVFPHYLLPKYMKKMKIDLMHYTNNMISIIQPSHFVVTIHDLIPFTTPETQQLFHRIYQQKYMKYAARKSKLIVTVSNNSRNDITRILGVNPKRIRVIPLAVSEEFKVLQNEELKRRIRALYRLPEKFILNVGSIQPGKNIGRLLEAFMRLKRESKFSHKLVIVGRKAWLTHEVLNAPNGSQLKDDVIFTGPVPQEHLPVLYNLAELFVYPSIYEGFGLPPLEAMACGIPVITSNCSSLPEVVGESAILVNPYSVDSITDAMIKVLSNPVLMSDLKKRGLKRLNKFSWEKTATQYLAVYKELLAA